MDHYKGMQSENKRDSCHDSCQKKMVIGMAYVTDQKWREIYKAEHGFCRGTIYAELDKPWLAGGRYNG